jgi:ABC-2 type transport system ATP-binding protein
MHKICYHARIVDNIVVVQGVSKAFAASTGDAARRNVVDDVSFTLRSGEVFSLLGPNGAGKTTTIKMTAGLIARDAGHVTVCGADPFRHARAARFFGTILEGNRNLYWRLTALENLVYFAVLKGMSRAAAYERGRELLDRFGLRERENSLVQKLSRGLQQRVAIIASLMHGPRLLMMDEPTLALDVEAVEDIKELIRELSAEGIAIILCSHQLPLVEQLADRVAIMREGRIVLEGTTREILAGHAGEAYTIKLAAELEPVQINGLKDAGMILENDTVICRGAESLYEALDLTRPVPLVSVQRDDANLTDIFMKVVRAEEGYSRSPVPTTHEVAP